MYQRSSDYLRRAAEADASANAATDPLLRMSWQACAESWRQMAEQAKRFERESAVPANDS